LLASSIMPSVIVGAFSVVLSANRYLVIFKIT